MNVAREKDKKDDSLGVDLGKGKGHLWLAEDWLVVCLLFCVFFAVRGNTWRPSSPRSGLMRVCAGSRHQQTNWVADWSQGLKSLQNEIDWKIRTTLRLPTPLVAKIHARGLFWLSHSFFKHLRYLFSRGD